MFAIFCAILAVVVVVGGIGWLIWDAIHTPNSPSIVVLGFYGLILLAFMVLYGIVTILVWLGVSFA